MKRNPLRGKTGEQQPVCESSGEEREVRPPPKKERERETREGTKWNVKGSHTHTGREGGGRDTEYSEWNNNRMNG